jgi:putative heme-binding domain-containing protein
VNLLLKRPRTAVELLTAVRDERLAASAIDATQAAALRASRDGKVKSLAMKVLPPPPSRESVIESFRPALQLPGDATRGHEVYAKRCISCHRVGSEGSAVGPDFTTVKNAGQEKLLFSILDPNREVAPQYVSYLVETKDGQDVLGILANDTPANLTVRQAYGRETAIPRANIKRMTSQGKSLMPEGLEEGMKPQELADLIAFIEGVK